MLKNQLIIRHRAAKIIKLIRDHFDRMTTFSAIGKLRKMKIAKLGFKMGNTCVFVVFEELSNSSPRIEP